MSILCWYLLGSWENTNSVTRWQHLLLNHIWQGRFCKSTHVMFTAVAPCCHVTLGRSIDFLVKCFFLPTRTFYFFVLPLPSADRSIWKQDKSHSDDQSSTCSNFCLKISTRMISVRICDVPELKCAEITLWWYTVRDGDTGQYSVEICENIIFVARVFREGGSDEFYLMFISEDQP